MFSLDNFYYILYENLLKHVNCSANYFIPFGSVDPDDLIFMYFEKHKSRNTANAVLFYDQEPLFDINLPVNPYYYRHKVANILANSEHSDLKKQLCKEHGLIDWYYFFHGFAALSWYRDYKYLAHVENKFSKVFISLNRLTTRDRSYRLTLVSKMMEKDLLQHGHVSLCLTDPEQPSWQDEVEYQDSKLSANAKELIKRELSKLSGSLVVDSNNPQGDLSAHAGHNELALNQSGLWNIVSETVFYYDKHHLTEKIFKPIVSHRPFILVAAPGNLAYLKSYGFKTFDRWIDESYDNELDHDRRLDMIVEEINKLSSLSANELDVMYADMKETLDYNFNHFYGNFKEIVVDEMLENFKSVVAQWNNGRIGDKRMDMSTINFDHVKKVLIS